MPYHQSLNKGVGNICEGIQTHEMEQATSANVLTCISKFLFAYRTTSHATTGKTPSSLAMGRRDSSRLDLALPSFQGEHGHRNWRQ